MKLFSNYNKMYNTLQLPILYIWLRENDRGRREERNEGEKKTRRERQRQRQRVEGQTDGYIET